MNVNEYAQRVLFSEDLDDKLRLSSDTIEFDFQQTKISPKLLPGRPDSLLFANCKNERGTLPARADLVDDKKRGRLLHFFANHELLAAELMALALLKFPDAPTEFRRGLFKTLVEEQKHTLWYIGRMKECGVELGEHPVSGFFWNTVSDMAEPIDYVSRLSLTFEQANLDYSRHFSMIMKQAGDERTARIMDKIYQDEIRHVSYGLEWFRHWKPKGKTDWQAYQSRMELPLSPSRAKASNGVDFNRPGRSAAGLDEDFIRQLSVFEKSKGRTPNLFHFNPDAEDQISAHLLGCDYQPAKKVTALIEDLEILQVFLARKDDVILMRKPPSLEHLERLNGAGFQLPEILPISEPQNDLSQPNLLADRNIRSIQPWSVSPELPDLLGGFSESADQLWRDQWGDLFSKAAHSQQFEEWSGQARVVERQAELESAVQQVQSSKGVVIKLPVSAAGRGVMFFKSQESAINNRKIGHHLTSTPLVVEPWHNRVLDFSVQFQISENQIRQVGLIRQSIDPKTGRYRGSISAPKFCKGMPTELAQFLMQSALPVYNSSSELCKSLLNWADGLGYRGPLGIDSYLYRDESGQLRHRAICEINPRYTMGRVAHEIRRQIAPGYALEFSIARADQALAERPIELDKNGKLSGGRFCLNEVEPNRSCFAAIIEVDKNPNYL